MIKVTISILALLTASAFGVDRAEKVTGEFVRAPSPNPSGATQVTEIAAHEAFGRSPQQGYFFTHNDIDGDGVYANWRLIDFDDPENTCVNVYGDGRARIGGYVSKTNEGNPLKSRYLGYDLLDGGQPNLNEYVDFMTVNLFTEPDPEKRNDRTDPRSAFMEWCETGNLKQKDIDGSFPKYVVEGNLKIHHCGAE